MDALTVDMDKRNFRLISVYPTLKQAYQECGTCASMQSIGSNGLYFECLGCKERFCTFPCFNNHYDSCDG